MQSSPYFVSHLHFALMYAKRRTLLLLIWHSIVVLLVRVTNLAKLFFERFVLPSDNNDRMSKLCASRLKKCNLALSVAHHRKLSATYWFNFNHRPFWTRIPVVPIWTPKRTLKVVHEMLFSRADNLTLAGSYIPLLHAHLSQPYNSVLCYVPYPQDYVAACS